MTNSKTVDSPDRLRKHASQADALAVGLLFAGTTAPLGEWAWPMFPSITRSIACSATLP